MTPRRIFQDDMHAGTRTSHSQSVKANRLTLDMIVLVLVACGATFAAPTAQSQAARPTVILLTNANVVDVASGRHWPKMSILVRDDRIAEVKPTGAIRPPSGSRTIDLEGAWVIPGFVDMHYHVVTSAMRYRRVNAQLDSTYDRSLAERLLRVALGAGITTIRDPGASPASEGIALRKDLRAGRITGPDLFVAGELINNPRLTDDELRDIVQRQAAQGVDYIKVYSGLNAAQVKVVADEAHRHGRKVIGHLQRTSWTEAARAGIDFITHGANWHQSYLPAEKRDAFLAIRDMRQRIAWYEGLDVSSPAVDTMVREIAARGISIDPTLIAYHTKFFWADSIYQRHRARSLVPELLENWSVLGMPTSSWTPDEFHRMRAAWPTQLALVRRLHEAGVLLTAGSDLASPWVIPGVGFHQELELLVSAGLSPAEVLRIATMNGAKALGVDNDRGRIATGQRADLVVLGIDPRRDITAIRKIRLVMKSGVIHSPGELARPR